MDTSRIEYNALIFHLFIKQRQRCRFGRLGTDFPRIIPLRVVPMINLLSRKSLRNCDQGNYPEHQINQGPELRKTKPQPVHINSAVLSTDTPEAPEDSLKGFERLGSAEREMKPITAGKSMTEHCPHQHLGRCNLSHSGGGFFTPLSDIRSTDTRGSVDAALAEKRFRKQVLFWRKCRNPGFVITQRRVRPHQSPSPLCTWPGDSCFLSACAHYHAM